MSHVYDILYNITKRYDVNYSRIFDHWVITIYVGYNKFIEEVLIKYERNWVLYPLSKSDRIYVVVPRLFQDHL